MGVPPPHCFGHRRSVRRRRPHSHRRRHFSKAAPVAGWSRHANRYDFGGALAKQWLFPTRAARSWGAGGLDRGRAGEARLEAHRPSPDLAVRTTFRFQLLSAPPRGAAASAAWRGFRCEAAAGFAARAAQRLPAVVRRGRAPSGARRTTAHARPHPSGLHCDQPAPRAPLVCDPA